jgi:hypothetical protein
MIPRSLPSILLVLFAASSFGAGPFTVTNTNDSGAGSLRQAILDANTMGGGTINFTILGAGVHTITPLTVLANHYSDRNYRWLHATGCEYEHARKRGRCTTAEPGVRQNRRRSETVAHNTEPAKGVEKSKTSLNAHVLVARQPDYSLVSNLTHGVSITYRHVLYWCGASPLHFL